MHFKSNIWDTKVRSANKYYEQWESLFECKKLERRYENFHWDGLYQLTPQYKPYTLNVTFSAIKTKLATILPRKPEALITPTPGNMDWDQDFAVQSALIKQDTLNTIWTNPNLNFQKHLKLMALDSFFRFGVIEVDYAADWENPQKQPIITTEFTEENIDAEQAKLVENIELPLNERIYYKHIKASRFRVSTSDDEFLSNCSWCGYFTFVYESSLRKTKGIKFPPNYTFGEMIGVGGRVTSENASMGSAKKVKVWKIWDNETKRKHLFLDGYFEDSLEQEEINFEVLPFEDLIHNERAPGTENSGFYPIPPCFYWTSPQDEINQAREQMRNFRRRYTRKFGVLKGRVEPEELDKFKTEYDGEIVEMTTADAIFPIENPSIGATITADLQVANDDFNKIAAVSQVQQSDRTTATQSKINAARETIREDSETMDFHEVIERVGRKTLLILKEKFTTGFWIKQTQDAGPLFGEVQSQAPLYQYISAQDLDDGYDFTIKLNIVEDTPEKQQAAQTSFTTFITLLQNFPMIAMSPKLIMETAFICGYRNIKVIKDIQQAALVAMMGQVQQGQQNLGMTSPAQGSMDNNSNPNPSAEVDKQLESQLA